MYDGLDKQRYSLFMKEEKYRTFTDLTYYLKPQTRKAKSCGPVDIDGVRYRLDYETGEVTLPTKKEIFNSKNLSVAHSKKLLSCLLLMNDFDWFCTLTFDKDKINRDSEEDIYKAYVRFINNIKHRFPSLRYITVLERHSDGVHIHFHMLIGGVSWKQLGLVNSGKVCCSWATRKNGIASKEYFEKTKDKYELKETDGCVVYNITSFVYGMTTATRIANRERCNTYVQKYLDKAVGGSTEFFKKRFYYSSNLNVPEVVRREILPDFQVHSLLNVPEVVEDPLVEFSKSQYFNKDYNVFKARIENEYKENIDRGLIPVYIETPFGVETEQEKFNLEELK